MGVCRTLVLGWKGTLKSSCRENMDSEKAVASPTFSKDCFWRRSSFYSNGLWFYFHLPTFYTEILPYIVLPSQTGRVDLVKAYGKKLCLKIWHIAERYLVVKKKVIQFFTLTPTYWNVPACKRLRHCKLSAFYIFKAVMLRETLVGLCSLFCHFAPIWCTSGMMIPSE